MKMKPDKMLYEKASAMARKMDETYDNVEKLVKVTDVNCKRAYDYAQVAKSEYDNMERLTYRAAIGHAVAIVVNVIVAGLTAAAVTIGMLE
jgi:hypothetical protein